MAGRLEDLVKWLDDRVGLGEVKALGVHKQVPIHRHSIWYYFGGTTLFLFLVQVITGILLTLYYRPSPTPSVAEAICRACDSSSRPTAT